MKKIFVISWYYPPVNSSEGLVTWKLLNRSQYAYDVFTQNSSDAWSYGMNAKFESRENVRTIFAKSKYYSTWKVEAFEYFSAHRNEYDGIMTRSMPQESHEAGLLIKKAFPDVKWIASFGDPIKVNPYQHLNCTLYSPKSAKNLYNRNRSLRWKLDPKRMVYAGGWMLKHRDAVQHRAHLAQIEDDTLRLADRIILNNRSQMRWMLGDDKALQAKTHLIRHSFEETLYPDKPGKAHKKMRFVFIGHLDEMRTPLPLLKAIKSLRDDRKDLARRAEFLFYGDMADGDLAYLVKNRLLDVVKFCEPVPYLESLAIMRDADWVVHVDADISSVSDENVFFAAKIADYFGSGSNLLAVTMPRGDVADVLRAAGAEVLNFSANEIRQALYLIIYEGRTVKPDPKVIEEFSARCAAERFDREVVATLYDDEH